MDIIAKVYDVIRENNISKIKHLSKDIENTTWFDRKDKERCLEECVKVGKLRIFKELLIYFDFAYYTVDMCYDAVFYNRFNFLKFMHKDLDIFLDEDLLSYSVKYNSNKKIIEYLCENIYFHDLDCKNSGIAHTLINCEEYQTPIIKAIINRDKKNLIKLIKNDSFVDADALVLASSLGYLDIVKVLVINKAPLDSLPVRYALSASHFNVAEYLLKQNPPVNDHSISIASKLKNKKIFRLISRVCRENYIKKKKERGL